MNSGIYKIKNLLDGKVYIGSAVDLNKRKKGHWIGYPSNIHLQRAMEKYGRENFDFQVLENCRPEDCVEIEQFHIDLHKDMIGWGNMYNICPIAGSRLGCVCSEESKAKMSLANKGEKHPLFGKHHSEETKAKISQSEKGKTISEETKAKLSLANKGKTCSEETRLKMSGAQKGRTHSVESKAKMSLAMVGNTSRLGKPHSKETKAKMSLAHKSRSRTATSGEEQIVHAMVSPDLKAMLGPGMS